MRVLLLLLLLAGACHAQTPGYIGRGVYVDSTSNLTVTGKLSLRLAHAQLSTTNTFTNPNASASNVVTFAFQESIYNITHTPGDSKFYVPVSGSYLIGVSPIFLSGATEGSEVAWWLRQNGTNILRSATRTFFPAVSGGGIITNVTKIPSATFNIDCVAGDSLEMLWWASATDVTLKSVPASAGSPPIPASPSVILTINRFSE